MIKKPLMFSLLCVFVLCAMSLHAWLGLPDLEQYPIHWNAKGEPDGFGSKNAVLFNLFLCPISAVFITGLFWGMQKIEPLKENLQNSLKAYNWVWMLTMVLFVGVGALIATSYTHEGGAVSAAAPRLMVIGTSVLFIGIGNVLGKVRQNFVFGIRTPWTLSSELSWEKTHRIGGRVFVVGGLICILAALFYPASTFVIFGIYIAVIIGFSFIYSYIIWKRDPNKRT